MPPRYRGRGREGFKNGAGQVSAGCDGEFKVEASGIRSEPPSRSAVNDGQAGR